MEGAVFTVVVLILVSTVDSHNRTYQFVTGPNVCVVNVTFTKAVLETFTSMRSFKGKKFCGFLRRCIRYESVLNSRLVTRQMWKLDTMCCEGFVESDGRCIKAPVFDDPNTGNKTSQSPTNSDNYSIGPPIVGTVIAIFLLSLIITLVILKGKTAMKRCDRHFGNRSPPKDNMSVIQSDHTYIDPLPPQSQAYETLDKDKIGITQNVYDSIETYKELKKGMKSK